MDSLSEDVTDLTDGSGMEVGRRKEEEARKARVSAIQNLGKTSICRARCTPHLTALVRASFMRTLVLSTNRDSLSRYDRPDRTLRLFDRYFYDKLGSVAQCRHAAQFATVFLDNFVGN
jgi:hypothetical protein